MRLRFIVLIQVMQVVLGKIKTARFLSSRLDVLFMVGCVVLNESGGVVSLFSC